MFCGVYLYGKMCSENEAEKQTAFLPSMFPYAHTRQEKRELMRLTKISRGGGEGNCEDERH